MDLMWTSLGNHLKFYKPTAAIINEDVADYTLNKY